MKNIFIRIYIHYTIHSVVVAGESGFRCGTLIGLRYGDAISRRYSQAVRVAQQQQQHSTTNLYLYIIIKKSPSRINWSDTMMRFKEIYRNSGFTALLRSRRDHVGPDLRRRRRGREFFLFLSPLRLLLLGSKPREFLAFGWLQLHWCALALSSAADQRARAIGLITLNMEILAFLHVTPVWSYSSIPSTSFACIFHTL